jgi:signal transduction histidine kinase
MNKRAAEILTLWGHSREVLTAALEGSTVGDERALKVCAALRELRPATLHACLLQGPDGPHLAIRDQTGDRRADAESALRPDLLLRSQDPQAEAGWLTPAPAALGLIDHVWCGHRIGWGGHVAGALGLALSSAAPDEMAVVRELLAHCADWIALFLRAESPRLAPDPATAWLNNAAEMTSLVTHEFNNHLNGILLQVAVLEQETPPDRRGQLGVIRRLGHTAAAMVKRLQEVNRRERPPLQAVALTPVVRDCLAALRDRGIEVRELPRGTVLPPVLASPDALPRLLSLVLTHAADAVRAGGGTITLRTEQQRDKVRIHVEDTGPAIDPALLPRLFEPFVAVRQGSDDTSMALAKMLVRRLQGNIQVDNRAEGGVAAVIELVRAGAPSIASLPLGR